MSVNKEFVHLHVHTEYSLLDGFSRIGKLVDRVKELGMSSVAITDHGAMFGVIDFYRAAKKKGVKPIIGMEAYLTHWGRTRFQKEAKVDTRPYHLLLLAKNQTGYRNLLKIASASQLDGYYYRPRIDHDFLAEHSAGLIATSGCLAAEIPRMVEQGREDEAKRLIGWYQDTFGAENFFFELQHHQIPELHALNRWLRANQGYANVPFVATNDVHYVLEEDYETHDTLLCVQTGNVKAEQNRLRFESPTFHLRTQQEMWRLFGEVPESLTNTLLIAEMCDVTLDSDDYHLPVFPVPKGYNAETYLRYLCDLGLAWRYGARANDPEIVKRLNHELKIIHDMGFDTYFLIVWDLCEFARHRDIWWNVRGSGAGSVAAYCLGITNIDPLRNQLIFERFLNPGRVSMPDIDLDYPEDRRAEMIHYCAEKYGEDKVAAIITFGTMGSKAAIRDVGRALDMPLTEVDRIARLIPSGGKPVKFKDALGDDPEKALPDLKQAYANDPNAKKLIDEAWALEGITRHASTHAAGVIVADKPLVEYLPLHRPTKGDGENAPVKTVTQFPMETCESLGLLKVDFLGLSTLTIMRRACEMIERYHGVHYDLSNIPYRPDPDDPVQAQMVGDTFEMLGRGETIGVFQLESQGMRRMLTDMRPQKFEHIVAGISLYRPGPMDYIPTYNRRLHGEEPVEYKHPKLQEILEETYGIIVYQESIMQIGAELFGYTLGEADLMRRAVSKKKKEDLLKHRKIFIERGPEHGVDPETAKAIFDDIEYFARYGFNKCLTKDAQIIDAQTGRLIRIGDLVDGTATIEHTVTLDTGALTLRSGAVTQVMENGVKPVFRLTTQLGRTITATANHPFFTFDGWRMLGELAVGDQIAVPRRIPVEGRHEWPEERLLALAAAIDSDDPDAALPDEVFELTNRQVALLLAHLWDRAGFGHPLPPVPEGRRLFQSKAPSRALARKLGDGRIIASATLAQQVQHLLLRQGTLCQIAHTPDDITVTTPPLHAMERGPGGEVNSSDVYWDRIVSIEYVGEEMTYDLTVPGTHNFVANDIIVHNSHAADYAVLTCQTAFLKCHYPHEYMAALMSVHRDNSAKVSLFAQDCHRMGIEVLPPTVDDSQLDFSIEARPDGSRAIRFGLGAVKNVGTEPLLHIIAQREQGDLFTDLDDFCRRVDLRIVNKRALESLVKVGALDCFGPRPVLLAAVERIVAFSVDHHKAQDVGQLSLFGASTGVEFNAQDTILGQLEHVDPVPKREMLNWEKELVGLYVTDHPLRELWDTLQHTITHTIADLTEAGEAMQGRQVTVAGLVASIRHITTKKGDAMAVLIIEDITGPISAVMFPRTWREYEAWMDEDMVLVVRGKADASRGDMQVIVDSATQEFEVYSTADDHLPQMQEMTFSWVDDDALFDNGVDEDDDVPAASNGRNGSNGAPPAYDDAPLDNGVDDDAPLDTGVDDDMYDEETGEVVATSPPDDHDAPTARTEAVLPQSEGAGGYWSPPLEPPAAPASDASPVPSAAQPPRDPHLLTDREMPGWLEEEMANNGYEPHPGYDYDDEQGHLLGVADSDPEPESDAADAPLIDESGRLRTPDAPAARPREDRESPAPEPAREHERDTVHARAATRRRRRGEPEPVALTPARLLTLTIERTGDSEQDRRRIKRLHGVLTQYPGRDSFRFILNSEHKSARLDFPNHLIEINDEALEWVAKYIGEENIRVEDLQE